VKTGKLFELKNAHFCWDVAQIAFGLLTLEYGVYHKIISAVLLDWRHMLTTAKYVTKPNEFLGLFRNQDDPLPTLI